MARTVAIIGAGYSGSMLAARLAEAGVSVRLINRTPDFGLGVAYSTRCDAHVLNVRSGRMSARADDTGHFVRWLAEHEPALADPEGFVPRRIYGLYVQATLAAAEAAHPGRIERIVGAAMALEPKAVVLEDGRRIDADVIVLATGNPAPRTAPASEALQGLVIPDPWAPGALEAIGNDEDIVIIGTGLTMVDVVLALDARGWSGRASALSRRGLAPRGHDAVQVHVAPAPEPEGPLSQRLAEGRRRARRQGWAEMMDGLRAGNARQWAGLDTAMRARFLRHLRPWWDVHRHRVATGPAARIAALIEAGRLRYLAGRVQAIEQAEDGAVVRYAPRHETGTKILACGHVIDCTGPGHDPARSKDPLTRAMMRDGQARPDALSLGLDVAADGRLIDASGQAAANRFVLGPPALAAYWETVAVPDLRERVEAVAEQILRL